MVVEDVMSILNATGESLEDAAEESFVLFSQNLPHNDLGIINDKADEVCLDVNGHEYNITQSPGLLRSSRAAGTTGAMIWKVTPRIAQWLTAEENFLWKHGLLSSSANIVELGSGVAGIIGMTLAPKVKSYILTDQAYVLKLLNENIAKNQPSRAHRGSKKTSGVPMRSLDSLHVMPFDWECDSAQNFMGLLSPESVVDMIIVCDCIYNNFLIEPLSQACADVCRLHTSCPTIVLIAQQLRTDEVFTEWLTRFLKDFKVWRVKDDFLPSDLKSDSGYVVHMALLRNN